jgi:hypothetical protein
MLREAMMGRTRFRGDDKHRLPAQKIEPYRLWFEFLKLASKDPNIIVDKQRYAPWGDYQAADFDEWWGAHWRELFAVDIGVGPYDENMHGQADASLVLVIPLYQDRALTLRQVNEFLVDHHAGERLADMRQGKFQLSIGNTTSTHPIHPATRFLRNLTKVRLLLKIYQFWSDAEATDERQRLEETAVRYFEWAKRWNNKIDKKKTEKKSVHVNKIELPASISRYVAYLEVRGTRTRISQDALAGWSDDSRRQVKRYLLKARRIAANVARGEFPGRYE